MAKASFSYVDNILVRGPKALLRKDMGCLFCISTAPIPLSDASVSISKVTAKSGKARTGAEIRACLRVWNAASSNCVQRNTACFFRRSACNAEILDKFSVISGQTKKTPYFLGIGRWGPFLNSFNILGICSYPFFADFMSQIYQFVLQELALTALDLQLVLSKNGEHLAQQL